MKCIQCRNTIIRSEASGWKHEKGIFDKDHVAIPLYVYQQTVRELSMLKYGPVIYESFLQITANNYNYRQLIIIIYGIMKKTSVDLQGLNQLLQTASDKGYSIPELIVMTKKSFGA